MCNFIKDHFPYHIFLDAQLSPELCLLLVSVLLVIDVPLLSALIVLKKQRPTTRNDIPISFLFISSTSAGLCSNRIREIHYKTKNRGHIGRLSNLGYIRRWCIRQCPSFGLSRCQRVHVVLQRWRSGILNVYHQQMVHRDSTSLSHDPHCVVWLPGGYT